MAMEDGLPAERQTWGNPVEFLMSCIAMSVGLGKIMPMTLLLVIGNTLIDCVIPGNIWRFPYIAYKNGGGAFLIPYLVVLLVIGKPLYFLEMAMGQFSSYGSVKVWEMVPILKGAWRNERTKYFVVVVLPPHYHVIDITLVLLFMDRCGLWPGSSHLVRRDLLLRPHCYFFLLFLLLLSNCFALDCLRPVLDLLHLLLQQQRRRQSDGF